MLKTKVWKLFTCIFFVISLADIIAMNIDVEIYDFHMIFKPLIMPSAIYFLIRYLSHLKFYKTFKLNRDGIKFYLEAENLLDERTPRRINPYTGKGYDPGEIIGYNLANSPDPNSDPSRFRKPRSVELGFQVNF